MKTLHRLVLLPFPLLLLCPARAEFNPAIVSADAQWVVSVDLNELRDSTLGKELLALAQKQIEINTGQNGPAGGVAIGDLRINFQKTFEMVGSVTAYGSNFSSDPKLIDGALVIQGTADLRKIVEAAALQATLTMPDKVAEVKDLPFAAYSIGGEVFVAFPPEPFILVSKSKARLLNARDVVRGAAPSLVQASSSRLAALLAKSGRTYVVAASIAPTDKLFTADGPQARILQLASSGMIAIGEEEAKTVAHLQLVANSDEMADKLLKIVQGMVAMMSLAETSDRQLADFLQSAVVDKQDRTVSVQLAYSSERLVQLMQNIQQQMKPLAVTTARSAPVVPPPVTPGRVVAQWSADLAPSNTAPGADLLVDYAVENVRLVNGATITLSSRRDLSGQRDPASRRDRSDVATFDYVDILPASGAGPALHFEAENMRLQSYRVQPAPYASRGKLLALRGSYGTAQFDFPGEDGDYQIHVHYVEQPPGKTSMVVNVKDPDPVPAAQ
jgi:hypothetical protein